MPTSDGQVYGFKYVNGHPKNMREGLQTVTAFGMLTDVASGYPVLLSEMTILTALRTAATSALAAKYLAPKGADCMALIGNGAQSEFQALAFKALLGVNKLRLFDIDSAATKKCATNLAGKGFDIVHCTSSHEAVEGAGIITTVTADKQYATILTDNMVGSGVHINAIGGDCPGKTELHRDILLRSDIFVEYPPQTRIEGEAIIGGDDTHAAISAASIVAKVCRDEIMVGLDRIYPDYGFARHKGYGTAQHRQQIDRLGPCQQHRRSFRPFSSMTRAD